MMRAINTSVRLFAEVFHPPAPVVELGAYYPPGYAWLSDLRAYFPGREYIGCDLRAGNGVGRIEDAQRLSFQDSSVGTTLAFEILEHVPDSHMAISEACRVLRDDGLFALSTPFNHGLHAFPDDYWRFSSRKNGLCHVPGRQGALSRASRGHIPANTTQGLLEHPQTRRPGLARLRAGSWRGRRRFLRPGGGRRVLSSLGSRCSEHERKPNERMTPDSDTAVFG